MLIPTEARKAKVHGKLRKPSTKRREVVKPTSNSPPTISQSQGMNILSLDEWRSLVTLAGHDEAAHHGQHDRAAALHPVHGRPVRCDCRRHHPDRKLAARNDERI